MAWLASYDTLEDHPKLERLSELTGVALEVAYYRLHCLWKKAMLYAPDGNLAQVSDARLAKWARWDGIEPVALVRALVECGAPNFEHGFLDADRTLHDWETYAGPWRNHLAKKKTDAARMAKKRADEKQGKLPLDSGDSSKDSRGDSPADVRSDVNSRSDSSASVAPTVAPHLTNQPNQQTNTTGPEGPAFGPGVEISESKKQQAEKQHGPTEVKQSPPVHAALSGAEVRRANGAETTPPAQPGSDLRSDDGVRGAVRSDAQPAERPNGTRRADVASGNGRAVVAKPSETEYDALKRSWGTFAYVLRTRYGGGSGEEGDVAARRFFDWAKQKRLFYAELAFVRLMLATYLDAKAVPIDAAGNPITDTVGYCMGWQKNRSAKQQERPPSRVHMQKANELLGECDNKLQKNGAAHFAWMDGLVKAWTKDAKPREAAGVGA